MMLVMAAILMTSPLVTAFETALLEADQVNPERFLFELGAAFGPARPAAGHRVHRVRRC